MYTIAVLVIDFYNLEKKTVLLPQSSPFSNRPARDTAEQARSDAECS